MVSSFALQKVHKCVVKKIVSYKKAKFMYRSLIDNSVHNPTDKFLKWEKVLDIEITDWSEYFVIMKRSCTYLRNFQFKFKNEYLKGFLLSNL
jgi:hypothetical protein